MPLKQLHCISAVNTKREVIPEAVQASVSLCQVPHYIYLSAITQTQAQFILNTLPASTIFSFNFNHKIQIINFLYLSVTSLPIPLCCHFLSSFIHANIYKV